MQQSEAGAKVFGGEEAAKGVAVHGQDLKKAGAKILRLSGMCGGGSNSGEERQDSFIENTNDLKRGGKE